MNNLYRVLKTIEVASNQHPLINEYGTGDIYEHLNSGVHKYPTVLLTIQSQTEVSKDVNSINFTLFYVDRLLDNKNNKISIQASGQSILKQILTRAEEITPQLTFNNISYQFFEEKFTDLCAGVYVQANVNIPIEMICSDSEYETTTITLTNNGIYDVIGYDKAIVNVIPLWGTIEGDITNQTDLIEYIENAKPNIEAGENIQITESGNTLVISATDTIYDDTEVKGLISNNTQAINQEIEDRTEADSTLQENIDAETQARIEADEELDRKIEELDDFTCAQIVPTTTNFVSGVTYSIEESLQRTANLFGGLQGEINDIDALIPNQATTENQLADKNFVNSTVATNAANFRGNWGTWNDVPTDANLYPQDYIGNRKPTNNDYIVLMEASGYDTQYTGQWRFMYTGDWDTVGKSGWKPQYKVGSSFTAAQQAALDSTITSTKVAQYDSFNGRITAVETDKLDKVYSSGKKIYGVNKDGGQTTYTAGNNIQLNDNGTISATDTVYDDSEVRRLISGKQNILTAGEGVNISGDTISAVKGNWIWRLGSENVGIGDVSVGTGDSYNIIVGSGGGVYGGNTNLVLGMACEVNYGNLNIVLGEDADADNGDKNIVAGYDAETTNSDESIAIGRYARVDSSDYGIALGKSSNVTGENGVAIGTNAKVTAENAVQLGAGTNTSEDTLKFRDYTVIDESGNIPEERLLLKTINGNDLRGEGNIEIEGSSKVKKVSVHKAIPVSSRGDSRRNLFTDNITLYYKPKNSFWTFSRVPDSISDEIIEYDGSYFDIVYRNQNYNESSNWTFIIKFDDYSDLGKSDRAYIWHSNPDVSFTDFLTNTSKRALCIEDVTDASDIPCKDDFRIERGKVICIKEPDLYIAHTSHVPPKDIPLENLDLCGNNGFNVLTIRDGRKNNANDAKQKQFTLAKNLAFDSGARIKGSKGNYTAIIQKGFLSSFRSPGYIKRQIKTGSIMQLTRGHSFRLYTNARKRYKSIKYLNLICIGRKFISKLN